MVAAILHDTLEDTALERDLIRERFGERVLEIVGDVTESPKTVPCRVRKGAYIECLRRSPRNEARAVASADKIHNLSNMISGLEHQGLAFAEAFTADIDVMIWYQRRVHEMLVDSWSHPILDEHGRLLDQFLAAAGAVRRPLDRPPRAPR